MRKTTIAALFLGPLLFPALIFAATYGSNVLTGGTPTCDGSGTCSYAFDGNLSTLLNGGTLSTPINNKYDLGSGVSKTIAKVDWVSYWDANGGYVKNVKVQGSNDDSTWDDLSTIQIANGSPDKQVQSFEFLNTTAYRYYRFQIQDSWIAYVNNITWDIYGYECIADCGGTPPATSTTTASAESVFYAGTALLWLIFLLLFVGSMLVVVNFYRSRIKRK